MSEALFYDLKKVTGLAPSLSAQVAREIGKRIVAGKPQPGNLLDDEDTLARQYRVSRSVIRDAIKTLSGKGLVEVRRGRGTTVRARSQWGLLDDDVIAWQQSVPADAGMLSQLMDLRRVLEPKAARWAAERGSDESHARILAAVERMEAEKGAVEDFVVADARFHRAILHATENEFLIALEGVIFSALLSSIRLTNDDPRSNEKSLPFHREVYQAIAARDGDRAERVMETLLGDTAERLNARHGGRFLR